LEGAPPTSGRQLTDHVRAARRSASAVVRVFIAQCVGELLHGMCAGNAKTGEVERAMDLRKCQGRPGPDEDPESGEAELGTTDGNRVGSRWWNRRRTTDARTAHVSECPPGLGWPQHLAERAELGTELGHPDREAPFLGVDISPAATRSARRSSNT
jgi:hypothetical protein